MKRTYAIAVLLTMLSVVASSALPTSAAGEEDRIPCEALNVQRSTSEDPLREQVDNVTRAAGEGCEALNSLGPSHICESGPLVSTDWTDELHTVVLSQRLPGDVATGESTVTYSSDNRAIGGKATAESAWARVTVEFTAAGNVWSYELAGHAMLVESQSYSEDCQFGPLGGNGVIDTFSINVGGQGPGGLYDGSSSGSFGLPV